jgi:hypothetical protein
MCRTYTLPSTLPTIHIRIVLACQHFFHFFICRIFGRIEKSSNLIAANGQLPVVRKTIRKSYLEHPDLSFTIIYILKLKFFHLMIKLLGL